MAHFINLAYNLINQYKDDPPPDKEWLEVQLHRLDGDIRDMQKSYQNELENKRKGYSNDLDEVVSGLNVLQDFKEDWFLQWQHLN